ncbi:unnamed protein product [Symbiodinium pilosum]|uniref:Uncharacterized protein n=1 Tax=Symbiodinium pilosum TaxID=2952 RepID=A0A812P5K2_SYMPI|nr:unnamed protein product [Symbiodinium pilosum]
MAPANRATGAMPFDRSLIRPRLLGHLRDLLAEKDEAIAMLRGGTPGCSDEAGSQAAALQLSERLQELESRNGCPIKQASDMVSLEKRVAALEHAWKETANATSTEAQTAAYTAVEQAAVQWQKQAEASQAQVVQLREQLRLLEKAYEELASRQNAVANTVPESAALRMRLAESEQQVSALKSELAELRVLNASADARQRLSCSSSNRSDVTAMSFSPQARGLLEAAPQGMQGQQGQRMACSLPPGVRRMVSAPSGVATPMVPTFARLAMPGSHGGAQMPQAMAAPAPQAPKMGLPPQLLQPPFFQGAPQRRS